MTPQEAIQRIQQHNEIHRRKEHFAVHITKALQMAVAALEKQIPQKPILEGDGYADGNPVYDIAYCPVCNHDFEEGINDWGSAYCPDCGQALDWEETNETQKMH